METLAQLWALARENRRLAAGTRFRIACSRRSLNPHWKVAGASRGDAFGDDRAGEDRSLEGESQERLGERVRARLASGELFPAGGKVFAGKGTNKPCIVCAKTISAREVEHEVEGPTTVWAHWDCYNIWLQESRPTPTAQERRAPRPIRKTAVPLHIDRLDRDGADAAAAEYAVSAGGSPEETGAVLIGVPQGLPALRTFLHRLGVTSSDIEAACRGLVSQPRHEIPNVTLTWGVLRDLGPLCS